MKNLLLILALLAPVQAHAQVLPHSAGSDYCRLRRLGVSHDEALGVAISENTSRLASSRRVTIRGKSYQLWALQFAEYVLTMCPGLYPSRGNGTSV